MSELDANLQYYILNIVLPLLFIWFIAKYVFGIRFKNMRLKLEALMFYHLCGRLHARLCAKEKLILFSTLPKLKKKLDVEHLNILEIGVGSGQNFSHYPEGTIITALDPNPSHESYLHKNLKSCNNNVNFQGFIKAYGENMSEISDESFDAVVCTLTLCSVRDSKKVLDEVHRVLRKVFTLFIIFFQNSYSYIIKISFMSVYIISLSLQVLNYKILKRTPLLYVT